MTTSRAVTVRLRPVWVLAAAAVLVATVLGPRIFRGPSLMPSPAENQAVVTFVAPFPTAHTVAVAGSFSGWSPIPLERTGGVFQARIAVEVGVHEYMFVLDGDRWLPDPLAESSVDDGFGRRNSVLVAKRNGV